jgi:hypothetical protein
MSFEWKTSLRQTFRLLPREKQSPSLRLFLDSDGLVEDDVLARLPYHAERAGQRGTGNVDRKRYRDPRQVYRSVGLLYERSSGAIRVTPLGKATRWWMDKLTRENVPVLARYAANALGAWQLRNPLPESREYAADVKVFPYAFIWRVMLAADDCVNSTELKCEVLRLRNEDDLADCVTRIREYRRTGDESAMQAPIAVDKDDRLIPWMSLASFGWALIREKDTSGYYRIDPPSRRTLERAAEVRRKHREFESEEDYLRHIEAAAALPEDLR